MEYETTFGQNAAKPPKAWVVHPLNVDLLFDWVSFDAASSNVFSFENVNPGFRSFVNFASEHGASPYHVSFLPPQSLPIFGLVEGNGLDAAPTFPDPEF